MKIDTNSSVSADTFSEAYIGLLYARNEVVTKAEFTELTNQFAEAQKEAAGVVVGNKEGEYAQETVVAFKKTLEELSVQADETKITKTELTQLSTKLADARESFRQSANQKDQTTDSEHLQKPENNTSNSNSSGNQAAGNGNTKKPSSTVKTGDDQAVGYLGVVSIASLAVAWLLKRKK